MRSRSYLPDLMLSRKRRRLSKRLIDAERKKLFKWLYTLFDNCEQASLLEIGGPTGAFEEIAKRFDKVVLVNLARRKSNAMIRADARQLPFRDKAFDYVFSNATLEHIPKADWPAVASEVTRVSTKGFFIVTPNYWFPFESHYLLPLFQWAPESLKRFLIFRLGIKIGVMSRRNYHTISLPQKRQLKKLFPEANVDGWGPLVPRHLVVWRA